MYYFKVSPLLQTVYRPYPGGKAAAALNERYTWSIVPALAAWPIMFMDQGPGSLAAALLLVSTGTLVEKVCCSKLAQAMCPCCPSACKAWCWDGLRLLCAQLGPCDMKCKDRLVFLFGLGRGGEQAERLRRMAQSFFIAGESRSSKHAVAARRSSPSLPCSQYQNMLLSTLSQRFPFLKFVRRVFVICLTGATQSLEPCPPGTITNW